MSQWTFRRPLKRTPLRKRAALSLSLEQLEDRSVPSTFKVLNLNDNSTGSLRQAILDANANPGADLIDFDVAGTIRLTSGALSTVTGKLDIDGTTAPGFAGKPVIEVDYNGFGGLQFNAGSAGSALRSLGLVNAAENGVTVNGGGNMVIVGNFIGLGLDGVTAAGNRCNGLELNGTSGNTIGGASVQDRNIISGNLGHGIYLYDSSYNQVMGNYIGTTLAGNAALGNGLDGVKGENSHHNLIGQLDPFQTIDSTGFSNLISGNRGNGIRLSGANDNQIAMNYIGTDATGTLDLGNAANGILVTMGSARNLIGGTATGGNNPTQNVFVQPPQGNLVSGNDAHGLLITGKATQNQLSGNFIGTDATGNSALGNTLDGVAIDNAHGNELIGSTLQQNSFAFYNVISGNGGNGLRVTNANDTTIQANFFGMGADNDTALGNALNGLLVAGSSTRTVMGGLIPLGNVSAANGHNGIFVRDTASFFTSYNTFCGLAAFSDNLNFGNGQDGMRITSKGGNILIRTNVIARNGDDGIEISGAARDVRVAGNIIGLNTQGVVAMGNLDNGVEVGGQACDILIGGLQPNIIPHNAISANGGNGVAIVGTAHHIKINFSYIGTDLNGQNALGNAKAGVYLGQGTYLTSVGSTNPNLLTVISGNQGDGVEMRDTRGNIVEGTFIGISARGSRPLANGGNGVRIVNSFDNVIGNTSRNPANVIAFNGGNGVFVTSGSRNAIRQNSIYGNALLGIDLGASANVKQAAPVLTSVRASILFVRVSGTFTSMPNTTYTIEFFANAANDPSGRILLGSQTVKTNSAGVASFTFYKLFPPSGVRFVTATATDPSGNTSKFSVAAS